MLHSQLSNCSLYKCTCSLKRNAPETVKGISWSSLRHRSPGASLETTPHLRQRSRDIWSKQARWHHGVPVFSLPHLPTVWQTFLQLLDMDSYINVTAKVKVRWSGSLCCNTFLRKFLPVFFLYLPISVITKALSLSSHSSTHSMPTLIVRNYNGFYSYRVNEMKTECMCCIKVSMCVACWDIFSYWTDPSPGGTDQLVYHWRGETAVHAVNTHLSHAWWWWWQGSGLDPG